MNRNHIIIIVLVIIIVALSVFIALPFITDNPKDDVIVYNKNGGLKLFYWDYEY